MNAILHAVLDRVRCKPSLLLLWSLLIACCASTCVAGAATKDNDIREVLATDDAIVLRLPALPDEQELLAWDAWETDHEPGEVVAILRPRQTIGRLARYADDGRDRVFQRFALRAKGADMPTAAQWVTDLRRISNRPRRLVWPDSIKGVSNPVSVADLVDLGVKHVHVNVTLGPAFLPIGKEATDPAFRVEQDGTIYHLNARHFADIDRELRELTDADINVIVVLLNPFLNDPVMAEAFNYPGADRDAHYSAFRLDNADSVQRYLAFLRFFVDRYTAEGSPHGRVGGIIVGNEIDSHGAWHNMGPATLEQVAQQHARELRLAHLAVRVEHATLPIFTSLTHSWTWPNSLDATRNVASKDLLDRLIVLSKAGGDFDWNVAYHPYPSNLFEPDFWNDRVAVFAYDTPQITFKNVEVLAAYLKEPAQLVDGEPRRLIFSEQGLHAGEGPEGEALQAQALAALWVKLERIDLLDAFILHRHLDHPLEDGLKLGLLELDGGVEDMDDPSKWRRRKAWQIYGAAGTPAFDALADPMLRDLPAVATGAPAGPFPENSVVEIVKGDPNVLIDLMPLAAEATVTNQMAWNRVVVELPDGGATQAIMLHPKVPSAGPASAAMTVELPDEPVALRFATGKKSAGGDGYVASVLIDGEELWSARQPDQAQRERTVDLSEVRGEDGDAHAANGGGQKRVVRHRAVHPAAHREEA